MAIRPKSPALTMKEDGTKTTRGAKRMGRIIEGIAYWYLETGMEGNVAWIVGPGEGIGWIETGDILTVVDHDGAILFNGYIILESYEGNMFGKQTGMSYARWAYLFTGDYQSILVKHNEP